jgi:hypothetical protein
MDNRFIKFMKSIYRIIVPIGIRKKLYRYRDYENYKSIKTHLKKQNETRKEVINFLEKELKNQKDPEKQNIVNFLKRNKNIIFPYDFVKKYKAKNVSVYTDTGYNMKYVLHANKRMYFPKNWDDEHIQKYYNWLLIEQDIDSPHRFETSKFCVQEGDVVADIGAAEGIFALSAIEKVKKLYLFECEETWIEALEKTFEPWKGKVTIVNKYIADCTNDICITLDEFLKGGEINFIKADIEGMETKLLMGAKETLATQKNLRMILCTYHKENDERDLKRILTESGFHTEFSKGYMILIFDEKLAPPYLRKGLIRATKA